MKNFIIPLIMGCMLLSSRPSFSRDFSYTYQGKTLTYTVIDEIAKTCRTKEGNASGQSGNSVSGTLIIPSVAMDGDKEYLVTEIGSWAFYYCKNLEQVSIPETVTKIGDHTFLYCSSLKQVNIPEGVTEIENSTFSDCTALPRIDIPETVTKIGNSAFYQCYNLTQISIPEGVTEIGGHAFHSCRKLTQIIIPDGVTKIGECTFAGCWSLTQVSIPEGVTEIGIQAFIDCQALIQVKIPTGVTKIEKNTFDGCWNLSEIDIPESVTEIDSYAFSNCQTITQFKIPEGVAKIGSYAFSNCYNLTQVNIPGDVTEIGSQPFSRCAKVTAITYNTTTPIEVKSLGFESAVYSNATLYVPKGATEAMISTAPWNRFNNIVELIRELNVSYNASYGYILYDGIHIQSPFQIDTEAMPAGKLSFTIIPKEGYRIEAIDLNDTPLFTTPDPDNNYEINLNKDILQNTLDIRFCEIGDATLTVSSPGHHTVTHEYAEGSNVSLTLEPQSGWTLHSATLNDEPIDFTADNKISIPAIAGHNNLNAIYIQDNTTGDDAIDLDESLAISLALSKRVLTVRNKPAEASVLVYDLSGNLVAQTTADTLYVPMSDEVAIVKVADKVFKVVIR